MKLPKANAFRCCGCGRAAVGQVKPCDCVTMVGARDDPDGTHEYVVFMSQRAAARLALSELIKTRILGIPSDEQDLVLEDADWCEVIAALEGDRP